MWLFHAHQGENQVAKLSDRQVVSDIVGMYIAIGAMFVAVRIILWLLDEM
jgi:hypothetical protein